jgi:hypothetical protein
MPPPYPDRAALPISDKRQIGPRGDRSPRQGFAEDAGGVERLPPTGQVASVSPVAVFSIASSSNDMAMTQIGRCSIPAG